MTIKIDTSCSIINFYDIQRVSNAIDDAETALNKLDKKLQSLRPKTGRTITHFGTGTAGFLPLPKNPINQTLERQEIARISNLLDLFIDNLANETQGYEASFRNRLDPILEQVERMRSECGTYLG